ncbi:DctP family TRAP transporter solute-binding subunit [Anaeromicropila herbilytica]|uniref:Methyl-accepting chemotaxis protein n=1 Tax=Anaeromicropila herbilytica TaxID=2785025 RepID=A0A7R7EH92_9FIRM|nr:DctP family TRAP transporter solute-binding subunit [Anaeromicropila herbilytica]BCN29200.1 hypothetical protein bsdtb5_04950 [Anaeromicropila herbilytica]
MFKLSIKVKTMLVIIGSLLVSTLILSTVLKSSTVAAVLLFIVLAIVIWGILSYLFNPLTTIITAMSRFCTGDFTVHIDVKRKDEFGKLSDTINNSSDYLQNMLIDIYNDLENMTNCSSKLANDSYEGNKSLEIISLTTGEIADDSEEIGHMIQDAAIRADKVSVLSQTTDSKMGVLLANSESINEAANTGKEVILGTSAGISQLVTTANENVTLTRELESKSEKIREILEMIEEIAGQTNLLALNAAIEAARAGEQGRGFSVVADEIRKLAEQSQNAAKQISAIVHEMVFEIKNVVQVFIDTSNSIGDTEENIHRANTSFSHITDQVKTSGESVQEVFQLTDEASSDATSLLSAVQGIASLINRSVAATQTVAASTIKVNQLIDEITRDAKDMTKFSGTLQDHVMRKFRFNNKKTLRAALVLSDKSAAYSGLKNLGELLSDKTGGNLELKIFHSEQLGNASQIFDKLKNNDLDIIFIGTHQVASTVKELTLLDLPFLFQDEKAADNILHGSIGRRLLDLLDEHGFHGLSFAEEGFRDITNSKYEVRKMEDLKNLKIRVANQDMHIKTIKILGGDPVPVKYDEVYNVLREKSVDGQDMPLVTAFNNYLFDVQTFLTLTHHSYASSVILCSEGLWYALDSKEKQQFEAAAKESARYIAELTRNKTRQLQESLSGKGLHITTLSDDERKKMRASVQPLYEQFRIEDGTHKLLDEIEKQNARV